MSVRIRSATNDDLDAIAELARESVGWHADRWPDIKQPPDAAGMRAAYADLPTGDGYYCAVAEQDGVPVGFLTGNVSPAPEGGIERHHGPVGYVADVAVTAAARRSGIATLLMNDFERWARSAGAATITLSMHAGNDAASALYRSLGFNDSWIRMRKDLSD
ncbi:GNAT family N-acetyltransferase [Microlunatus soli]|uniref:GNAT family N-acetyltransferase n=1 Tax=Microlunatus soli TaxID=630515 RepID=UPI0012F854B1|nr:GNAT family N-acetyltransferase [Microlunatus soli]